MSDEANTWFATLNRRHTVQKADVLHARAGRQRQETALGATQAGDRTGCASLFSLENALNPRIRARGKFCETVGGGR